jgi:hypothetical protein
VIDWFNAGLLVVASGAIGLIALGLFVDDWAEAIAARLLARRAGRRAYRAAYRAALGLPAENPSRLEPVRKERA